MKLLKTNLMLKIYTNTRACIMLMAFVLLQCSELFAQISEDFTDGDFTSNPAWQGDDVDFAVIDQVLQLDAAIANTSYLSTPVDISDSTFWEFLIELDFNPSASQNFPKVYLSSDNPDLKQDLNGYFLRIGESGSDDAFEIYSQTGASDDFLFRFDTEGAMEASSNNIARVRITRNDAGVWNCYADYDGGTCFGFEGTFTNTDYPTGSHFGVNYKYTITNVDNFFIDDIFVDVIPASQELALNAINPLSASDIVLTFNKQLNVISAQTVNNYTIKDGSGMTVGNPTAATIDASNTNVVHLDITNLAINSGEEYTICAENLLDCSGALIGTNNTGTFAIFITIPAMPGDIIINEIFADPEPTLSTLPIGEYVELYNRSANAIDLTNYEFSDASSSVIFPSKIIPPFSYLIICDEDFADDFMAFGDVLALSTLPALNNDGDQLTLRDLNTIIIDQVSYSSSWYLDPDKSSGGWSLELINPSIYCIGEANWQASLDPAGGTPGQENSVFDNIPDDVQPKLAGAIPINDHQLRLQFNEIMSSQFLLSDFVITSGTGIVTDAILETPDKTSYLLTIEAPFFQDQTSYNISLQNVLTDCVGNPIDPSCNSLDFTYYEWEPAVEYDIIFNELYPDPTPSLGLPEAEFIELHNRSNKIINLEGFILSDRSADIELPYQLIFPDDYLILYLENSGSFGIYGDTLALSNFVGLGNEEDDLELTNPNGDIIDAVQYTIFWYQDSGKSDGGWTLELVNPYAPCTFEDNWRASVNPTGGTPGQANSILEDGADGSFLDLIRAFPSSSDEVRLFFNKRIDLAIANDPNNYQIDGLTVIDAFVEAPLYNTVVLQVNTPFEAGITYEVSMENTMTDCIGNMVGMFDNARFALPEEMEPLDLIINEVLFNPEVGGVDFVELYNRSDKVLNLANLNIATRNEDGLIDDAVPMDNDYLSFPDEYIVLTKDPLDIKNRYQVESPYSFLDVSLPTYEDKQGTVTLYVPTIDSALVIDEFYYEESFQYALLSDKNGISLERINPEGLTQSKDNWHSAAEQVGYGTPTYKNSQFLISGGAGDDLVWVENARLSPDEDGFEDFLIINYKLPSSGFSSNINIFDAKGRLVKDLIESTLLGNEGTIKWDGITNENKDARPGIYILHTSLINPNGQTFEYKKAFVLATQLN